ncbi:MAG TPA: hypothetical protein VFH56_11135 [Acidimicrobiales bacterium]|nr:hypothetical protein [Acidimicrobiales bacterium]
MSAFSGPQQKGALRTHRATKRAQAEARAELAAKRAQARRIVAAEKEEDE